VSFFLVADHRGNRDVGWVEVRARAGLIAGDLLQNFAFSSLHLQSYPIWVAKVEWLRGMCGSALSAAGGGWERNPMGLKKKGIV
jgi:hypothetical protein